MCDVVFILVLDSCVIMCFIGLLGVNWMMMKLIVMILMSVGIIKSRWWRMYVFMEFV